jgi:hypothetical protein
MDFKLLRDHKKVDAQYVKELREEEREERGREGGEGRKRKERKERYVVVFVLG